MCERDVVVGDLVEEVDLFLLEQEGRGDRVDRRVAPALIKETAVSVERVEVVEVLLRSQPVEVSDLEVGPLGLSAADV